ncbi:MAG: aminotransferase class I/II-fold pyridoxal phosphate-dependent enzyme, partial [Firmicutes bacterium]|nr:aminotransferase class I/II-fold pyridoxal phosphate-dependent enzyme [Bacillota bacterium]
MGFEPARRMRRLPPQFFAGLVARANARAAAGRPVINLGQGNPDLPTPRYIVEALLAAGPDPRFHRYIGFRGLDTLKQAAAGWYRRRFGVELDPVREVAILIGTKVGLQEIALTLLNPGDRAVVPDPGYPDYWSGIALAGGELTPWRLEAARGFVPDLAALPAGARLVFVNSPQNPTGRLLPPAFYHGLIDRAR